MKREEVYQLIDGERSYQNAQWPDAVNPENPNPLTIGEFVLLLDEYVTQARREWAKEKKPEKLTMNIIRKVAGISVNALEQHGADPR